MMLTSFTFHPWVAKMRDMQVSPRGLADDLTVIAIRPNHEERFRRAFEETMRYLHTIGAKPAPNKCFTFSSNTATRVRLAAHHWQQLQAKVKVVREVRDLGGHLSTSANLGGATLTCRMKRATAYCHRLACFPWTWEAKRKVVETLIYPLGLYGCEAAPINDAAMAKLNIAVAKAIGPYSHRSSTILSGLLLTPGRNLTPEFQVLNRSVGLLRRIITKHPRAQTLLKTIYAAYLSMDKPGTIDSNQQLRPKPPAPPAGQGSRAAWNQSATDLGPIGLLLSRLHYSAAYLQLDCIDLPNKLDVTSSKSVQWSIVLTIKAHPYIKFDVLNCPRQHLRRHVDDFVNDALSKVTAVARTVFKECGSIDKQTYFKALATHSPDLRNLLQRAHVQALWTDELQARCFEVEGDGLCKLCKQQIGSLLHPWTCPALKSFRESLDPQLAQLSPSNTPEHILLGIPNKLIAGNTGRLIETKQTNCDFREF